MKRCKGHQKEWTQASLRQFKLKFKAATKTATKTKKTTTAKVEESD